MVLPAILILVQMFCLSTARTLRIYETYSCCVLLILLSRLLMDKDKFENTSKRKKQSHRGTGDIKYLETELEISYDNLMTMKECNSFDNSALI